MSISVFPAYLIGAIVLLKRNDGINGNVFLVFATFFGSLAGITSVASYILTVMGIPFEMTPVSVCWILSGILLLGILPGIKNFPWTYFLIFGLEGVALVLYGIAGFGLLGSWWSSVVGWMFFVVGILGIYCSIVGMNETLGIKLPLGKSIFKA